MFVSLCDILSKYKNNKCLCRVSENEVTIFSHSKFYYIFTEKSFIRLRLNFEIINNSLRKSHNEWKRFKSFSPYNQWWSGNLIRKLRNFWIFFTRLSFCPKEPSDKFRAALLFEQLNRGKHLFEAFSGHYIMKYPILLMKKRNIWK